MSEKAQKLHHDTAAHYVKREELLSQLIKPYSPISHSQAASFDICPENHNEVRIDCTYTAVFHFVTYKNDSVSELYDGEDFQHKLL